jgi:hypothetical protein
MADSDNIPNQTNNEWQFQVSPTDDISGLPPATPMPADQDETISWTASEFIAHHKSPGWYLLLTIIAVVLAVIIWFLTRDAISVAVIIVGAAIFGTYAARKPHQVPYQVDEAGIGIGIRHYGYEQLRSFAIVPEGAFSSIVFMPLKRFMPVITIYYAPQDEARIVETLSARLPVERQQGDMIDRLMRRIRF